jgi:hypothetical protein
VYEELIQRPQSNLEISIIFGGEKNMEFLTGRTPIQDLLSALPEEGDWIFNYQTKR